MSIQPAHSSSLHLKSSVLPQSSTKSSQPSNNTPFFTTRDQIVVDILVNSIQHNQDIPATVLENYFIQKNKTLVPNISEIANPKSQMYSYYFKSLCALKIESIDPKSTQSPFYGGPSLESPHYINKSHLSDEKHKDSQLLPTMFPFVFETPMTIYDYQFLKKHLQYLTISKDAIGLLSSFCLSHSLDAASISQILFESLNTKKPTFHAFIARLYLLHDILSNVNPLIPHSQDYLPALKPYLGIIFQSLSHCKKLVISNPKYLGKLNSYVTASLKIWRGKSLYPVPFLKSLQSHYDSV